jgi:hypothetical protein
MIYVSDKARRKMQEKLELQQQKEQESEPK